MERKHQGHGSVPSEGAVQEAPGAGRAVAEHIWRGGCEHRDEGDSDLLLEEVTLSWGQTRRQQTHVRRGRGEDQEESYRFQVRDALQ